MAHDSSTEKTPSMCPRVPSLDSAGHLDFSSVERLSYTDVVSWMRRRFRHADTVPMDVRSNERPHDLFVELVANLGLSEQARGYIQWAGLALLEEVSNDPQCDWADEVLCLIPRVLGKATRGELKLEARAILVKMLNQMKPKSAIYSHPTDHDAKLVVHALRVLVEVGYNVSEGFWLEQYHRIGPFVTPLIFEGLCQFNPEPALRWLAALPWSSQVEITLSGALPRLVEDYHRPKVEKWLTVEAVPRLKQSDWTNWRRAVANCGLELDGSAISTEERSIAAPVEDGNLYPSSAADTLLDATVPIFIQMVTERVAGLHALSIEDRKVTAKRLAEQAKKEITAPLVASLLARWRNGPESAVANGDSISLPLTSKVNRCALVVEPYFWWSLSAPSGKGIRLAASTGRCVIYRMFMPPSSPSDMADADESTDDSVVITSVRPPATWLPLCELVAREA